MPERLVNENVFRGSGTAPASIIWTLRDAPQLILGLVQSLFFRIIAEAQLGKTKADAGL